MFKLSDSVDNTLASDIFIHVDCTRLQHPVIERLTYTLIFIVYKSIKTDLYHNI